jgi:2-methylisocitrate lyase-like PEP mutase family enzyme
MAKSDLAATFRALHAGPALLILPNIWDAGSARLVASLGARAIATTSSGVAWAHGYRDGNYLPIDIHAAAIREISRAVDLPVTVDAEAGYSSDPAVVGEVITRLIDAGAVGINLEDGSDAPDLACAKIEAAREAAARAGVALFVNSRTDVFLRQLAPGREVDETLARAKRYAEAGCDGLFIPGATDAAAIRAIAAGTPLPVNVMARPGLPPLAELRALGVRRLSAGAAIVQAALGLVRRLSESFLAEGVSAQLFLGALPYPELNQLMLADNDQ